LLDLFLINNILTFVFFSYNLSTKGGKNNGNDLFHTIPSIIGRAKALISNAV